MSFGILSSPTANSNSPFRQLVQSLMEQESVRKVDLENRINQEERLGNVISQVSSNLNSLDGVLRDFEVGNGAAFTPFTALSTDENAVSAISSDLLRESGNLEVNVQQIARADLRLGTRFNLSDGNDLATQTTDSTLNRTFSVRFPASAEDGQEAFTATITLDELSGRTNREILVEVADKLNQAAGDRLSVSLVSETGESLRLRVRSDQTGEVGRMEFFNEPNIGETNIASVLGLTTTAGDDNMAISDGSSAGRLFATDELNARFTVDGMQFERSTNMVEDVITGVDLELKQATDEPITIQLQNDTEKAIGSIENFISTYNNLISNIQSNSNLNTETGERGLLARDRTFANLGFNLRNRMLQSVDTGSNIQTLLDIGIEFRENGELFIADQTTLEEALSSNSNAVKELFTNENNGLSVTLRAEVDQFLRADTGIIDSIQEGSQIRKRTLESQLESEELFLTRREALLNQQFLELEQLSTRVQSQFASFSAILGG